MDKNTFFQARLWRSLSMIPSSQQDRVDHHSVNPCRCIYTRTHTHVYISNGLKIPLSTNYGNYFSLSYMLNFLHNLCQPVGYSSHYSIEFNSFPPGQNGRNFEDDIFNCIFVIEKFGILIEMSLKFLHKDPINYNSALVKTMAWRRIGDKPLSEPMLTHLTDAYVRH